MDVLALYDELNTAGARFYHWAMEEDQAVTIELAGQYAVFMDFSHIDTTAEEKVIVAHEGGHISTGATHKVSSPYDLIEKHEQLADRWAIKKLLPFEKMRTAMQSGYTQPYQLAEYFDVTEPFVLAAIRYYTDACGYDFNITNRSNINIKTSNIDNLNFALFDTYEEIPEAVLQEVQNFADFIAKQKTAREP